MVASGSYYLYKEKIKVIKMNFIEDIDTWLPDCEKVSVTQRYPNFF